MIINVFNRVISCIEGDGVDLNVFKIFGIVVLSLDRWSDIKCWVDFNFEVISGGFVKF